MPTVLIADDHPAYRAGVRSILEAAGFAVVAEAGDRRSAIQAAVRERPDICVVDLDMPGGGLNAVRGIVQKLPDAVVVVLTVSDSSSDLLGAVQAIMNPPKIEELGLTPKGGFIAITKVVLEGALLRDQRA